jgi:hypothetical protein
MVKKYKKPIEKTVQLQKIELPFLKWYLYFFKVGKDMVFVDPALVVGSIFTEKWEVVFPCSGKLLQVGYNVYALKAVSPAFTDYRLHLLDKKEDVPVSRAPYSTQTFRLGDRNGRGGRVFAYFVPLPEDEYEEDRWWDDGIDDYYDDD